MVRVPIFFLLPLKTFSHENGNAPGKFLPTGALLLAHLFKICREIIPQIKKLFKNEIFVSHVRLVRHNTVRKIENELL